MRLIKPSEISASILTLLDESDERVIIVSPYMKISKWYKFRNKIKGIKNKGILTEIYIRDDPENTATYNDLDHLNLEYNKIPHLHCKLYLNERSGIVTSLNLLLSSEINSLEIGYATETWKEYKDLLGFFNRYIQIGEPVPCDTIAGQPAADMNQIMCSIREELKRTSKNPWLWLADNILHISTGQNSYRVSIISGYLSIAACLRIASPRKKSFIQSSQLIAKKVGDLTSTKNYVQSAPMSCSESGTLQLTGQANHPLESACITGILEVEAVYIIESVIRFIDAADNMEIQDAHYSSGNS